MCSCVRLTAPCLCVRHRWASRLEKGRVAYFHTFLNEENGKASVEVTYTHPAAFLEWDARESMSEALRVPPPPAASTVSTVADEANAVVVDVE